VHHGRLSKDSLPPATLRWGASFGWQANLRSAA
jgi:hypothetical protein